jgi:hypothetical protein
MNKNIKWYKKLTITGDISTTRLGHYAIYSRYDYYRKLGNYVGFSVLYTSEDYKVSKRLVYRIIKNMEEQL